MARYAGPGAASAGLAALKRWSVESYYGTIAIAPIALGFSHIPARVQLE